MQKELVLAVYEVGQCFFQGWGVKKDKVMGVVSRFTFRKESKLLTQIYRATSRRRRSWAIPTHSKTSHSASRTARAARRTARLRQSGIEQL